MKGGITKRLEDTIKALDAKQIKKALYLTENNPKLERQHQFVEEAARTCLANKDNKEICQAAIKEARNKIQDTVSLPTDDTSLEGLEEYMTEQKLPDETKPVEIPAPVETPAPTGFLAKAQITDEELFDSCQECHVAVAVNRFGEVCEENPEEAGGCEVLKSVADENTEPADWIKAMVETAEKAQGKAKEEMTAAITELTEYLERKDSPFLKALDNKEEGHA